jgi:hypothetical protein
MMIGLGVFAAAVVGLAAWAARAEDIEAKAAARAIDNNDPDAVDPNTIKGEKWTLDFKFENPEPIVITDPEKGEKQVYWYVVYTITNNTGGERSVVPVFTLYGDTGAVRKAGLYPTVHDAIKKSRKIKFLENAVQVIGKIAQGEDSARTGVAIFAPLERETDHFTVFVEGLSGEYIERPDRTKKIEPGHLAEGDKLLRLRKTLALAFDLPGDKWWMNLDQPIFKSKKWTWR